MALTALFAIGKSSGQFSSLVCKITNERLGDQLVFRLAVEKRLIRHLRQHGNPCAANLRKSECLLVVVVGLALRSLLPPVM